MKPYVVTVTLNPAIDKTVVVEKLHVGGLNRVQSVRMDPGGKGINVARVLTRFDIPVAAAGLIAGVQGENLLQYLAAEEITASFLTIPGETRTNLKIVDNSANLTTEINEAGFSVGEREMDTFKQQLSKLLNDATYLVLSGSLPPGVKCGIYRELTEIAKHKGVKTILDADDAALFEGIQAAPFAIKPNIHELGKLTGHGLTSDRDVMQAACKVLEKGIEMIVVSMGAQGAIIMDKAAIYRAKTGSIVANSTVGAGDSMVAVLAYSLAKQHTLAETARWVTAAGTVTASKAGTQVCSLAEVQGFLSNVQVERI